MQRFNVEWDEIDIVKDSEITKEFIDGHIFLLLENVHKEECNVTGQTNKSYSSDCSFESDAPKSKSIKFSNNANMHSTPDKSKKQCPK